MSCARLNCSGLGTMPSTLSVQSVKLFAASALYCAVPGFRLPFWRNTGDISARLNSCARALRSVTRRCAPYVAFSPRLSAAFTVGEALIWSQPASSRPVPPTRALRRVISEEGRSVGMIKPELVSLLTSNAPSADGTSP